MPGYEVSELFGESLSRGWVSDMFMYLHLRMILGGRQDVPYSHRA